MLRNNGFDNVDKLVLLYEISIPRQGRIKNNLYLWDTTLIFPVLKKNHYENYFQLISFQA